MSDSLCTHDTGDLGICNRPQGHPIHTPLGLSAYEHRYVKPVTAEDKTVEMVVVTLSKKNIKKIAKESGKTVLELEWMRQMGRAKGKTYTVRYPKPQKEN